VLRVPADYPHIRAAIDAAIDGDTVRIAYGRYSGAGNTQLDLLGKAIVIKGEGDPDSTIISCRLDDGRSRNGFVFSHGEGNRTVIKRLTITGSGNGSDGSGSAIVCRQTSPEFEDCVFRDNGGPVVDLYRSASGFFMCRIVDNVTRAREPTIKCYESSPKLVGCEISSNQNWETPALDCGDGHIEIRDCRLERNVNVHGAAGAIALYSSTAVVISTTIAKNICGAASGGALSLDNGSSVDMRWCTVVENSAEYSGGGIMARGFTVMSIESSIVRDNCAPRHSNIDAAKAALIAISGSAVDTSGIGGEGPFVYNGTLVTADPMFCRASGCDPRTESDYHLQPGSPCAVDPPIGAFRVGCEETGHRGKE
jgi:hypothetical protein